MRIKISRTYTKVFDDGASISHTVLGIISVLLDIAIPISIIYAIYQYIDSDAPEEKLGDLIEYAAGVLIGAAIIKIFALPPITMV